MEFIGKTVLSLSIFLLLGVSGEHCDVATFPKNLNKEFIPFQNLGQEVKPITRRSSKKIQINEECYQYLGKDFNELIQSAIKEGKSCLSKLKTSTSLEHILHLNEIMSNYENPLKIKCKINEKIKPHMIASTEFDKDHPRISVNGNHKRKTSWDDENLKDSLFHEVVHLIVKDSYHSVLKKQDYAVACDACCSNYGPKKDSKVIEYIGKINRDEVQKYCDICAAPPIEETYKNSEYINLFFRQKDYTESFMRPFFLYYKGINGTKDPNRHCELIKSLRQSGNQLAISVYFELFHVEGLDYSCTEDLKLIKK